MQTEETEKKRIDWSEDGGLSMTIDTIQPLYLPMKEGGKKQIGTLAQKTIQIISKDCVIDLQDFISDQKKQIEDQIVSTEDKLKELVNVKEGLIPVTQLAEINSIFKNNPKKFSTKPFKFLENYLKNIDRKLSMQKHLETLNVQLGKVNEDYDKICKDKVQ